MSTASIAGASAPSSAEGTSQAGCKRCNSSLATLGEAAVKPPRSRRQQHLQLALLILHRCCTGRRTTRARWRSGTTPRGWAWRRARVDWILAAYGVRVTTLMSPDMPTPTELGRGSIDLKPVVEAGLRAGVTHIFVEQEPPFKEVPAMEAAELDYRVLKSLLSTSFHKSGNVFTTPSPGPPRLVKALAAGHPLPRGRGLTV